MPTQTRSAAAGDGKARAATSRQRDPARGASISFVISFGTHRIYNRSEGFQLTRILSESRVRVVCYDGDSDFAAAFFFFFFFVFFFFIFFCHRLFPAPPWEGRVLLRYAQCFRRGWNPCVPVRTLSSHGIFVWPASHKSKVLIKFVACVAPVTSFSLVRWLC